MLWYTLVSFVSFVLDTIEQYCEYQYVTPRCVEPYYPSPCCVAYWEQVQDLAAVQHLLTELAVECSGVVGALTLLLAALSMDTARICRAG